MDEETTSVLAELAVQAPYQAAHPWVVQAITGFLSACFMEYPGFRVQRHFDEPESGMHIWLCEIPATLKVPRLLKRLQADIPACRISEQSAAKDARIRYIVESMEG